MVSIIHQDENSSASHDEILAGVPEGLDALILARLVQEAGSATAPGMILHVARDDRRLEAIDAALAFFAPKVRVISFPGWDTVPYDRVGPNSEIVARRMTALARLIAPGRPEPTIVVTTVNAVLQRLPSRDFVRRGLKQIAPGQRIDMNRLIQRLQLTGYQRTGTVMEPGEFAVRGGILDLFPPARINPVRLDFFGDTLESIKSFDAETQRSAKIIQKLVLVPVSEIAFGADAEKQFRGRYVELFGGPTGEDPLYQAVSSGHRYPGMEHWLPLFHAKLETLFDFMSGSEVSFDHLADEAIVQRFNQITEHYQARVDALETEKFGAPPYKPVPPDQMYISGPEWNEALQVLTVRRFTPFEEAGRPSVTSVGG